MKAQLTAPKIFWATFLAIIAAVAAIALTVEIYQQQKRAAELHSEIEASAFAQKHDDLYDKLQNAESVSDRDKIISQLEDLYKLKDREGRKQERENAIMVWNALHDVPKPDAVATSLRAIPESSVKSVPSVVKYPSLTLTKPFQIKDSLGNVIGTLQPGQSIPYMSRDNYVAWVRLSGQTFEIPLSSTNLK